MRSLVLVALMSSVAAAQPSSTEPEPEPAVAEPEPAPAVVQPEPEPPRPRTPFDQGRFGLGAGAGTASVFGQRYYYVGAGATYYVLDGVGVGLSSQVQWGGGPTILRTTPELRYVAQPLVGRWPLIPYVAVFYTHWFVGEDTADVDAIGTRGGLLYVSGSIILGLGVAYEHLVSECMEDCSAVYPDLTLSIAL